MNRSLRSTATIWGVLTLLLVLRFGLLALDPSPRFFLGDSESYLATRIGTWIPPDRSWLYGLGIGQLLQAMHGLGALLLVQTAFAAFALALLGVALLHARLALWVVVLIAVAVSLEPLMLYYDRAVLTDSPGAAALCGGLALALIALRRNSVLAAVLAGGLFVIAVALRTAVLPPILWTVAVSIVLALWPVRRDAPGARFRVPRSAAAALAFATLSGLMCYANLTGQMTKRPAALNPNSGIFLLGAVAPMLEASDFAATGVKDPQALLDATHHRERGMRNAQLYYPGELVDRLRHEFGDEPRVSDAAGAAARAAIRRDPAGFAKLALLQAIDYLHPALYVQHFPTWAGLDRPLPDTLVRHLEALGSDSPTAEAVSAPSRILAYLQRTASFLPVLVWGALIVAALGIARLPFATPDDRPGLAVITGAILAYLAGIFGFSAEMVPRYLLPLVSMIALGGGLLVASLQTRGMAPGGLQP